MVTFDTNQPRTSLTLDITNAMEYAAGTIGTSVRNVIRSIGERYYRAIVA